jgi:hypothetical protein
MALALVGPVAAQSANPVEASLTVSENELNVGDPIEVTLSVKHPADFHVIFPELDPAWGDFVVSSQSPPVMTVADDGLEITSQVIDLRLFAPGTFTTLPLAVSVADTAGQVSEVVAEPVPINITSVLVEGDTNLRDIKPQAELPFLNLLPWIAGGLVIALAIAVIAFFIRRGQKRRALAANDNRLPHEVALDELDLIEGLALPDAGRFKEHYSLVSDCVRLYMEKRYDVPMLERTTGEIQNGLRQTNIESSAASQYLSLLDISDLVKFSKYTPEAASAYAMLSSARQIVQTTLPDEEPVEGNSSTQDKSAKNDVSAGPKVSTNGNLRQSEVRA